MKEALKSLFGPYYFKDTRIDKTHEYDRDTRAKQRIKEQINFVNLVVCFTYRNGKKTQQF
jgi:hypothetical protein